MPIHRWTAHDRPRERLRNRGPSALASRELLAILIGSGGRDASALDVAAGLLDAADESLRALARMDPAGLESVRGVGPATASRLHAAFELGRRVAAENGGESSTIHGPADVHARMGPRLRDLPQEEFHVLLLDVRHRVIREVMATRGTLDASLIHPREVFRLAILERGAGVILVHNHPSGDPTPSPEDRRVTRQLADAGTAVGIPVLDHVVIGDGRYVSFSEAGLL
jgi:DNA repair protein RadC